MKVLLIIPAYNEEKNIKRVIENLKVNLPDCDYIIINDCSKRGAVINEGFTNYSRL